jgi:dTMP kinase
MDSTNPAGGVFLVLEGIDGSGKTTNGERLAAAIADTGRSAIFTREPGGTAVGEAIRALVLGSEASGVAPETEALLFAAARAQHVAEIIRPALDRGSVVVCDRFTDSTLAYQWGGRGLSKELLLATQRLATGGIEPDLKLLLDLPVEVALARRHAALSGTNRLDKEEREFHERVRTAYYALVELDSERWRVIDASRSPELVWAEVVNVVNESHLLSIPLEARGALLRELP